NFFFFFYDVAIDLGTENTLIRCSSSRIVVNEPSCVALKEEASGQKKILAAGQEAVRMIGRVSNNIRVIWPLSNGVIIDQTSAILMVKAFLSRFNYPMLFRPRRVVISAPHSITNIERRTFLDLGMALSPRETNIVPEPVAAALGSHINIFGPKGYLVVDIGRGILEAVVISMGEIVVGTSLRLSGRTDCDRIKATVHESLQIEICQFEAEKIMRTLESSSPPPDLIEIRGMNFITGLPVKTWISSSLLEPVLKHKFADVENCLMELLEQTPPELARDIAETGIFLTGGGCLFGNLPGYLEGRLGISVHYVKNPLESVASGNLRLITEPGLGNDKLFVSMIS
ncbi:MAG: rod shape-determining protein, partial [Oligoflexales bacterium]|nr:rod shape-determining protein [Oligoflexales bacterium]